MILFRVSIENPPLLLPIEPVRRPAPFIAPGRFPIMYSRRALPSSQLLAIKIPSTVEAPFFDKIGPAGIVFPNIEIYTSCYEAFRHIRNDAQPCFSALRLESVKRMTFIPYNNELHGIKHAWTVSIDGVNGIFISLVPSARLHEYIIKTVI